jgi:putative ABC transport system substrate-binding protein
VIALIVDPNSPNIERMMKDGQEAARAKGVQLHILMMANTSTESEIDAAFETLAQLHAAALVVGFFGRREQLLAPAAQHAVPALYYWREFAAAGGLISYGASLTATFRLAGAYCGKILNGADPADLPVQRPTTFELVINLKTANALGITIPQTILPRADEVIE